MLFQTAWAADPPPFVIRETFHQDTAQPQTDKSTVQHGIVGLDLLIREGYNPLVQDVFPGTPAERQGVLPGDIILTINGVSTLKKSINQVDAMISDQPGDGVTFLIKRGSKVSRVYLVVVALEALNPRLRSNFTGLFEPMP